MTPRRLSHFELHDQLGAGGMGVIYRAIDTSLRRPVAIKLLPPAGAGDAQRARFLAEARAASALNHPGIVTIYEVGSEGGVDFIAMELVAGETLAEILAAGPLPEERALDHARQLASALAAAHRAGIVHRDLKPANVVVTAEGRLKVLDFGLAKRVTPSDLARLAQATTIAESERTVEGTVLGTPAYMAPEQARGLASDARTDLFALGAILYEELTGARPFAGRDTVEIFAALLRDSPAPPSARRRGVSKRWDPILARLLARDPDERFPSAEGFLAALDSGFGERAARHGPRSRRAVPAAAALAVLALAAVFAMLLLRDRRAGENAAPSALDYEFRLFSDFPGSHREPTMAPDGSAVAFVSEDAQGVAQIWVRSLAGGDPIQITHGGPPASTPRWARRGDQIVFAREGAGVWSVPPFGGSPHRLIEEGRAPDLSPDGDRLVFVRKFQLWLAAGDGSDPRPIESLPPTDFGYEARASFSPDGRALVAFWPIAERPFGDLWRIEVATGVARKLTDLATSPLGAPAWSGDGRTIVFASNHAGTTTLWSIAAEGGGLQAVTRGAGEDTDPTLSPDGRRLVYTNARNSWRLVRFDPATRRRTTILEERRPIIVPSLSPDGRRVAFFARAPRAEQVFLVEVETGRVEQLTHGERILNVHPRWSRDGSTLLYYREAPDPHLRTVGIDGRGDRLLVPGWHWMRENYVQPSPDGRSLLYVARESGRAIETRVRDLASGETHALATLLIDPNWTPDGGALVGLAESGDTILRCRLDGTACRELASGSEPRLAGDGRTLYLLRGSPRAIVRRDLVTGREEMLGEIAGFEFTYFNWSVHPDGTLIYPEKSPGREELWIGERSGGSDGGPARPRAER